MSRCPERLLSLSYADKFMMMPILWPFRAVRYAGPGNVTFAPGEDLVPRLDPALLAQDAKSALYVYRQQFRFPGDEHDSFRDSVVGLLDRSHAAVFPHEEIFPERADACRRTVEESGLESSPIFLWCNGAMPVCIGDVSGHGQIWPITDPASIGRIQAALKGKALFLADGHHRFAAGWRLAAIHFRDESLRTLAAHRLVLDASRVALPPLIPINDPQGYWDGASPEMVRIAVIMPGPRLFGFEMPAQAKRDLTLLHQNVLHDAPVRPVRGIANAFEAVRSGAAQMAFLVEPLTLDLIEQDAQNGNLLPPKSTDFFPKVAGGVVMHRRQNENVIPAVPQMPGVRNASS